MLFLPQNVWSRYLHIQCGEHGHGMPTPERCECTDFHNGSLVDLAPWNHAIEFELRKEVLRPQTRRGVVLKTAPELVCVFSRECQTGCVPVSAELDEEFRHGLERIEEMKSWDAAPGALCIPVFGVLTENEDWPVKPL